MKSFSTNTKIINGKLTTNRNAILDAFRHFEGVDIVLTLKRKGKQRSTPQNAFYWGVLIPLFQEGVKSEWGEVWSKDKAHEFLKNRFVFFERVNEQTGEVIKTPKSTTENTTTQQEEYHTEIRTFLLEWFNIDAPLPNENLTLEL